MTFDQIFAGRFTLMRAERHICQANPYRVVQSSHGMFIPVFCDTGRRRCFHNRRAMPDRIGDGIH